MKKKSHACLLRFPHVNPGQTTGKYCCPRDFVTLISSRNRPFAKIILAL